MYQIRVGVLIEKDNKLLLIEEANSENELRWNVVKGPLEEKLDSDLFDCAKRLAHKLLNVDIEIKNLVNILVARKESGNIIQFDFLASLKSEIDPEKSSLVRFFTKEELVDMGPLEFINSRAYASVHDFLEGRRVGLDVIENVSEVLQEFAERV